MPARLRWAAAAGPMAATILTLARHGWTATGPFRWHATVKDQLMAADVGRSWQQDSQILAAFRSSVEHTVWHDASHLPYGQGLQQGKPDFSAARELQHKYRKEGHSQLLWCLETAATGCADTVEQRPAAIACPLCGCDNTARHRYGGQCPGLVDEATRKVLGDTEYILAHPHYHDPKWECLSFQRAHTSRPGAGGTSAICVAQSRVFRRLGQGH